MTSLAALFICAIFIIWLFARDRKLRPMSSWGLWVALLWIAIVGSRFVSFWFNVDMGMETPDDLLEGSSLDRNIFLILIIAGLVALVRRKPDWGMIFNSNRWFFAFFIYCGISILWSDYHFVSFKRWVKELGNIIMVLIILTEKDPVQATRAVFARYTYLVIPLSVLFITYFPDIGVYYDTKLLERYYGGVATDKNTLGIATFICGLFLFWEISHAQNKINGRTDVLDLIGRFVLLLMTGWLMYISDSKSALVCLILGTGIIFVMKLPFAKGQVRFLGTYCLMFGLLAIVLYSVPSILDSFVRALGRDATFTGRTELWEELLKEPLNPFMGKGYQGFWLGSRADYFWDKYLFKPRQAHNGYLETYLSGGLIGVCLLIAIIVSTGSKLKKALLCENSFAIFLFAVFVTAIFYAWTEAMFSRLNLFWIVLSIAALYCLPARMPVFQGNGTTIFRDRSFD